MCLQNISENHFSAPPTGTKVLIITSVPTITENVIVALKEGMDQGYKAGQIKQTIFPQNRAHTLLDEVQIGYDISRDAQQDRYMFKFTTVQPCVKCS